jgi:hypothetical protein
LTQQRNALSFYYMLKNRSKISLSETRTLDPTDLAIRPPTNHLPWLVNSLIPWQNHFWNNLGFEHTTTLGLLKSFTSSFLPPSYNNVCILALIVLELHSFNILSGDNWEICHLLSWEVYTTRYRTCP